MPRSSGTYSPPSSSWYPATSGASATFGDWNTLLADISAALTQSLSQDGQTNPTANLPMAGFKFTGAGNATGSGQFVTWGQNCTLGTVTMDGSLVTGLNASNLSSGTVPDDRFPATLPSGVAVTTAAQFDNTTKPASTAFVQRALGNFAGTATYNTSTAIASTDAGKWIFVPSGTGAISLSLPTVAMTTGSQFRITNNTASNNVTITTTGAITSGSFSGGSVVIGPGQTFDIMTDGVNNWLVSQGDFNNQARLSTGLNASGSAPMYVARAWVNFNGTGTVAINGSGNVTSITDNGVGDYTVNFTTALPSANYSVSGSAAGGAPVASVILTVRAASSSTAPTTKTTTAVRVQTSDADSAEDSTSISVVII